ncbi:MAG: hypothetical protein NUV97_04185 [archaeon]|nr:hypothetical protein [archaeon]MCR4323551.1 hypothetical protein [Nanoarchaeota archaeon]
MKKEIAFLFVILIISLTIAPLVFAEERTVLKPIGYEDPQGTPEKFTSTITGASVGNMGRTGVTVLIVLAILVVILLVYMLLRKKN